MKGSVAQVLGRIVSSAFAIAVVGGLAVVGLRSCVTTVWTTGRDVKTYSAVGDDDRTLAVMLLPRNRVILWHSDGSREHSEVALAIWRGTDAVKYPGGWWHFPSVPMAGPNIRKYQAGFEPVFMEMEVLEKQIDGNEPPAFPPVNRTARDVVLFAEDRSALYFDDMLLEETPVTPVLALYFLDMFADTVVQNALRSVATESSDER